MKLRDIVDEIVLVLGKHCDRPEQAFLLHVADILGFHDAEISQGQFIYKAVVNSGVDLQHLYRNFVTTFWTNSVEATVRDHPISDPLGSLVKRAGGDKYQTEEFALTDPDVVHRANKKLLPEEERVSGFLADFDRHLQIKPENILPVLDPTCGTGRVGMDLVAYYPAASLWNVERDLDTYRIALLNGHLMRPFTLTNDKGLFRWNTLWADSLIVDVRDQRNWELGANHWTPPDWRTTYTTAKGKTWADLERELGDAQAFELVVQDSTERARQGG